MSPRWSPWHLFGASLAYPLHCDRIIREATGGQLGELDAVIVADVEWSRGPAEDAGALSALDEQVAMALEPDGRADAEAVAAAANRLLAGTACRDPSFPVYREAVRILLPAFSAPTLLGAVTVPAAPCVVVRLHPEAPDISAYARV
ncbi:MAG: hypothetical protein HY903_08285 [Deltaproteobacteria bacterium]|nr:hypothetical protein [Deltaproteobacteria bacterium]